MLFAVINQQLSETQINNKIIIYFTATTPASTETANEDFILIDPTTDVRNVRYPATSCQ